MAARGRACKRGKVKSEDKSTNTLRSTTATEDMRDTKWILEMGESGVGGNVPGICRHHGVGPGNAASSRTAIHSTNIIECIFRLSEALPISDWLPFPLAPPSCHPLTMT